MLLPYLWIGGGSPDTSTLHSLKLVMVTANYVPSLMSQEVT